MAVFVRWWSALLLTVTMAMNEDEWPACTNTWGQDLHDGQPQEQVRNTWPTSSSSSTWTSSSSSMAQNATQWTRTWVNTNMGVNSSSSTALEAPTPSDSCWWSTSSWSTWAATNRGWEEEFRGEDEPLASTSSSWPTSSTWPTSDSYSSETAAGYWDGYWDRELCLTLQAEEIENLELTENPPGPSTDHIPLPFGLTPNDAEPQTDWLQHVVDKRVLRGRRHSGTLDTVSDQRVPSSSSWDKPPSVGEASDPAATSSWEPPVLPLRPAEEGEDHPVRGPDEGVPEDEGGVTQRWGVQRPGRDRWHHADGSIRIRLREKLAQQQEASQTLPTVDEMEPCSFQPVGLQELNGETVPQATTFYGEEFKLRVSTDVPLETLVVDDTSTTAGETDTNIAAEHSSTDDGNIGDGELSEGSSPGTVGFWRHGIYYARPRTPDELRAHQGGSGMRRTLKKQSRMDAYFRGEWKPAWLRQYAEDRARREAAAASSTTQATTQDLEPPLAAQPQGTSQWTPEEWEAWYAWEGWQQDPQHPSSTSSTSSRPVTSSVTTSSSTWPVIPNAGLFPEVREVQEHEEAQFMQLTMAEQQRLREQGVPQREVQRLGDVLQSMDEHQIGGTGPESRWAIGCIIQRSSEAIDALEMIVEVLARRVVPRGYLPVRRVPHAESARWRMFTWARQVNPILANTLEMHLQTPLQPGESEARQSDLPIGPEPVEPTGCPSPNGVTSDEEHFSAPREGDDVASMDSQYALDEDGRLVEVVPHVHHPADPPRGPPPPEPVNGPPPTSSSSSSETGSSTDCPRGPPPAPLSPQGIWKSPADEVLPDEDAEDDSALVQTLMIKDALQSTTSTTSTTHTTHTPDTNVRDMVNAQMVQGNMVDTVEVLRRLLDRQRYLRHCDRLIGTAL